MQPAGLELTRKRRNENGKQEKRVLQRMLLDSGNLLVAIIHCTLLIDWVSLYLRWRPRRKDRPIEERERVAFLGPLFTSTLALYWKFDCLPSLHHCLASSSPLDV